MSSLLDHDYNKEYDRSLSAWGDGMLAESELLDFHKPDAIIADGRLSAFIQKARTHDYYRDKN